MSLQLPMLTPRQLFPTTMFAGKEVLRCSTFQGTPCWLEAPPPLVCFIGSPGEVGRGRGRWGGDLGGVDLGGRDLGRAGLGQEPWGPRAAGRCWGLTWDESRLWCVRGRGCVFDEMTDVRST